MYYVCNAGPRGGTFLMFCNTVTLILSKTTHGNDAYIRPMKIMRFSILDAINNDNSWHMHNKLRTGI